MRLIPPGVAPLASLCVNAVVGLAILLWNAVCLGRWVQALGLLTLLLVDAWWLRRFHWNAPWLIFHLASAWAVRGLSAGQVDAFLRFRFQGGRALPVGLALSLLCSLQLLGLNSTRVKKPATGSQAASVQPAAGQPTPSQPVGVYRQAELTVEYHNADEEQARHLTTALLSSGLWRAEEKRTAVLEVLPTELKVVLIVPPEAGNLNDAFKQQLSRMIQILAPTRKVVVLICDTRMRILTAAEWDPQHPSR